MNKIHKITSHIIRVLTVIAIVSALLIVLSMLTGCASYIIRDKDGNIISQGDADGFLRTMTVTETYDDSGRCRSRTISTESTTKDVLMGLNEFIDSAVNTVGKIK
jgi:YD repeat-containing protein